MTKPEPGVRAACQELIEELMGSVVTLNFVLETLIDLPTGALPGEDMSEAIRELLIASACREVAGVGEEACRSATALIQTVVDRIASDVGAAAELAGVIGQRPC